MGSVWTESRAQLRWERTLGSGGVRQHIIHVWQAAACFFLALAGGVAGARFVVLINIWVWVPRLAVP